MSTRRTSAQHQELAEAIVELVAAEAPMTVRQAFYVATTLELVPKDETTGYRVIGRHLRELRQSGRIPFEWIRDFSRTAHRPDVYPSVAEWAEGLETTFFRDLWLAAGLVCEVWCEKDTLVGPLLPVTQELRVPLLPCRGHASLSYLHTNVTELARRLDEEGMERATVFYVGDFDPTGENIAEHVQRWTALAGRVEFVRLAVLPEQVLEWELPSRTTKGTDSRTPGFRARHGAAVESCEVEAIRPTVLRTLVRDAIVGLLPPGLEAELEEQETVDRARIAAALAALD